MTSTRKVIVTFGLVLAGAATPLLAHAIGGRCWIYLPAHAPPLLAGLALGPVAGLATGTAAAVADLLWGGRLHGLAFLPVGLEFICYGLVAGAVAVRSRRLAGRFLALGAAMVAGRLVHLAAAVSLGGEADHVLASLFTVPWPGMLLQLALLPFLVPVVARPAT